jgi:hypothetical protein
MPEAYYRFRAEIVRRGPGRGMKSALVAAAYRSGQRLHFEREGLMIDYTKRRGVIADGLLIPPEAPTWMADRTTVWNTIETIEKRRDARLARDFTLSLPHQFTELQMHEAVTGFLDKQFVSRGLICDFAIHAPGIGDRRNYHAHALVAERPASEAGFSAKKDRGLNERGKIEEWRAAWEAELNHIFQRDGLTDQKGELYFVDRRSYKERGIDKEAGIHLGPAVTKLERAGVATNAGNANREVDARNAERALLRDELDNVTDRLNAEERRAEKIQWFLRDQTKTPPSDAPTPDKRAEENGQLADYQSHSESIVTSPTRRRQSRGWDLGR